ncbi:hypothetical protein F5887DRAFT_378691 [Amanita rubescens]|nr:hypothetical protein F5887DRAFT_378691 [Amanita rubescens]
MPKEGHPYSVIAWYAWISPWLLGESSSPARFMGPLVQIQTDSLWATTLLSIAPAPKANTPLLVMRRTLHLLKRPPGQEALQPALQPKPILKHAPGNLGVQLLSPALCAQLFPPSSFSSPRRISRDHLATHSLDPFSLPSTSFSLPSTHFQNNSTASVSPQLLLTATSQTPLFLPSQTHPNGTSPTKYYYKHAGGASFSGPVPFPIHDGIPESCLFLM